MGKGRITLETDNLTRSRWDQLKTQLRNFLNNNPDVLLSGLQYVEVDPP